MAEKRPVGRGPVDQRLAGLGGRARQPPRCLAWRMRPRARRAAGRWPCRRGRAGGSSPRRRRGPCTRHRSASNALDERRAFVRLEVVDLLLHRGVGQRRPLEQPPRRRATAGERVQRGLLGVVVRRERIDDLTDDGRVARRVERARRASLTRRWSARMRSIPFGMVRPPRSAEVAGGVPPARSQWRCTESRIDDATWRTPWWRARTITTPGSSAVDAGRGRAARCRRPTPRSACGGGRRSGGR